MLSTQQYAQKIKALEEFVGNRELDADEAQELDGLLKGLQRSRIMDEQMAAIDPGGYRTVTSG